MVPIVSHSEDTAYLFQGKPRTLSHLLLSKLLCLRDRLRDWIGLGRRLYRRRPGRIDINVGDTPSARTEFASFTYKDAQGNDVKASLTPTQLKVLLGVMEGRLNKQIAYDLGISEATVKAHMTAILKKLDVQNRTQAVLAAKALGMSINHQ